MTQLPLIEKCPEARACIWWAHGFKHFPHRDIRKSDTRHGPARYLPETSPATIEAMETETVRTAERVELSPGKSEYLHDAGEVIGWDMGKDATYSFAECSGGQTAGRRFHGQPMATGNHKLGGKK